MNLNPNITTCAQCGQKVNITHFINALSEHKIGVAVTLATKIIERKPITEQDEVSIVNAIAKNAIVPKNTCGLCRQPLPRPAY